MKKLFFLSLATLLLLSLVSCNKNDPGSTQFQTSVVSVNGEAPVEYNTGELASLLEGRTVESLKWKSGSIAAPDIAALRASCIKTLKDLDLEKVNFAVGTEEYNYALSSHSYIVRIQDRLKLPAGMLARFTALQTVILPTCCRTIGIDAIRECPLLHSVNLQSVSSIEEYAFMDNPSLESLSFPGSLQHIGPEAFYKVPLKEITLPSGVSFYDNTFIYYNKASKLEKVICKGKTPPAVSHSATLNSQGNVFNLTPDGFKILVPASAVDAYKTADKWSKHADQIFAAE